MSTPVMLTIELEFARQLLLLLRDCRERLCDDGCNTLRQCYEKLNSLIGDNDGK